MTSGPGGCCLLASRGKSMLAQPVMAVVIALDE